jgi:hypothetical protein
MTTPLFSSSAVRTRNCCSGFAWGARRRASPVGRSTGSPFSTGGESSRHAGPWREASVSTNPYGKTKLSFGSATRGCAKPKGRPSCTRKRHAQRTNVNAEDQSSVLAKNDDRFADRDVRRPVQQYRPDASSTRGATHGGIRHTSPRPRVTFTTADGGHRNNECQSPRQGAVVRLERRIRALSAVLTSAPIPFSIPLIIWQSNGSSTCQTTWSLPTRRYDFPVPQSAPESSPARRRLPSPFWPVSGRDQIAGRAIGYLAILVLTG